MNLQLQQTPLLKATKTKHGKQYQQNLVMMTRSTVIKTAEQ